MYTVKIPIFVESIKDSKSFYCEKTNLFEFVFDYGMDTILLSCVFNPTIQLILSLENYRAPDSPVFTLNVEDCKKMFDQFKISIPDYLISKEVFEYPLGKNFLIKDPSNNLILISEEMI